MSNIVEFIPKAAKLQQEEEAGQENLKSFVTGLLDDTEQMIFMRVTYDGNITLGHSPMDRRDLIVMYHMVNKYIADLLEDYNDDD
jgi:hypothetical protein